MTYLDNGRIRLGLDLDMGGAVRYLADTPAGSNMINSKDHGRQVQLSFYSGPVPFQPPGATLDPNWRGLGWNPIQAGDAFGHGSRVTRWKNDGHRITVRCVPLIWPLNNIPAECVFESTYKLAKNVVEVDNRLIIARSDHTQYPARGQELPAVYSNGRWYKLVSYVGDEPFTGGPPTVLVDRNDHKGWPWLNFFGPEHWAALLDENNFGIGVFESDACQFGGGFFGNLKGVGGPEDDQTGYVAPNLNEILDYNITYQFHYDLIVGNLDEIRRYAVSHARVVGAPHWTFRSDRQHWTYQGTTDAGWPIKRELRIKLAPSESHLFSPETLWTDGKARVFQMDAAFDAGKQVSVEFERTSGGSAGPFIIAINANGKYSHYETDLTGVAVYSGPFRRVKVTLPAGAGWAKIRAIGFK